MAIRVSTDEWNGVYEQVVKLTERRNAFFGIWDGANKVSWACNKLLREYDGKKNRDEKFVHELMVMAEMSAAKVHQLDPELAAIEKEIDRLMTYLHEHEGVA